MNNKETLKRDIVLLFSTAFVAVLVYSYKLSEISFWIDEIQTTTYIKESFWEMIRLVTQKEACPPLYYIMLHTAHLLGANDELTLRIPSLLLAFFSIITIYFLAKELYSAREGIISSFLLAISPLFIICARDARLYSFFIFINCLLSYLFLRAIRYEKFKDWLLYTAVLTLSFYGHYFVAYIGISQFIYLCILCLLKEDTNVINKNKKEIFLNFILSGIISTICFIPWIDNLLIQISRRHEIFLNISALQKIKNISSMIFFWLCGGSNISEITLLVLVVIGIVSSFRKISSVIFLLINLLLPIIFTLIYFLSINWVFQERYSSYLLVPLIILASKGISELSQKFSVKQNIITLISATFLVILFLNFFSINRKILIMQKENWKDAASVINQYYDKDDIVTGFPPWTLWCLSKYGAFDKKNKNTKITPTSYIYSVRPHNAKPLKDIENLTDGNFELLAHFPGWNPINIWRGIFSYSLLNWNLNSDAKKNSPAFTYSMNEESYGTDILLTVKKQSEYIEIDSEEIDITGIDGILISGRSTVSYYGMKPKLEFALLSSSGEIIDKKTITPMAFLTGDFTYFGWYRELIDIRDDVIGGKLIFSVSGRFKKGDTCKFVDIKIFGHKKKI